MDIDERLDYLIEYLARESGRFELSTAKSQSEKWRLFRSLVNARVPLPVAGEFLRVQDELLRLQIAKKGITDIVDLQPIQDNLYLWRGDITALKVDAIVNAANSGMLGCFVPCHGCIDNAIHTYAGGQLRLECAGIMERQGHPEPTGKAKITAAYNLPSKFILHTVGPIITGPLRGEDRQLLACCYRSCLELAGRHGLESVAFCCISTGEFHFPNEDAADIAIETVTDYLNSGNSRMRVIFNVFTERDERIYRERLI